MYILLTYYFVALADPDEANMREMIANVPIVAAVFAVLCLYSPVLSDEEKPTVTIDFGGSYEDIRTVHFEMATFIK